MRVNYQDLSNLSGKTYRTVRKRLEGLSPIQHDGKGIFFDSTEALPLIYLYPNGDEETLDLSAERARLAKEQADGQALKNAKERKELLPATAVKETWSRIITAAKTQFLALPDRLAAILETAADFDDRRALIDSEVKTILNGLAEGEE